MRSAQKSVSAAILFFLAENVFCSIEISDQIRRKIEQILLDPIKVYSLDISGSNNFKDRIDRWVGQQMDLKKSQKRISGTRLSFIQKNTGINGEKPKNPYQMSYIQEPHSRRFIKMIDAPTQKICPDEKLLKIASTFITNTHFCEITEEDNIAFPIIHVKKRLIHDISGRNQEQTWNLVQRVEYGRILEGIPVINSRQTMHIHPETEEILAYKISGWFPVDIKTGQIRPYYNIEELIELMRLAYQDDTISSSIVSVELARYQDLRQVFPVLVVKVSPNTDKGIETIHRDLIIPLVKNLIPELPDNEEDEIEIPKHDEDKDN